MHDCQKLAIGASRAVGVGERVQQYLDQVNRKIDRKLEASLPQLSQQVTEIAAQLHRNVVDNLQNSGFVHPDDVRMLQLLQLPEEIRFVIEPLELAAIAGHCR